MEQAPPPYQLPAEDGWTSLAPGLDLGVFTSPAPSDHSDSRIVVVRGDPRQFELVVHMASAELAGGRPGHMRSARQWAEPAGEVAAINTSMFRSDWLTSTHYLQGRLDAEDPDSPVHVNNGDDSRDNAMLAFDPLGDGPEFRIVDRGCGESFDEARAAYRGLVQSIRMVSCKRTNTWGQQPKQWSHAAVGIDGTGRILFVHARSPWTTHDFVDILLGLPIDLRQLQYAEGGPEAQLWVGAGRVELERAGSYETGFFESDKNDRVWPLPNALALRPRSIADPEQVR